MTSWSGTLHFLCGWPRGSLTQKVERREDNIKMDHGEIFMWKMWLDWTEDGLHWRVFLYGCLVFTEEGSYVTRVTAFGLKKIPEHWWVELWAFMRTVMNLHIPVALRYFVTTLVISRWRRGVFVIPFVRIVAYWLQCVDVSKLAFVA